LKISASLRSLAQTLRLRQHPTPVSRASLGYRILAGKRRV
jgi:hypothetical protein